MDMKRTEREIDMIRGKMTVGAATLLEVEDFLQYVDVLESMVEEAAQDDIYGTEGWKHSVGWED